MKFDKEHLAVTLSALVVGAVIGGGAGYAIKPIPEPETVEVEKIVEKTVEKEVRVPSGPSRGDRAERGERRRRRPEPETAAVREGEESVPVAREERGRGPRDWMERMRTENPEQFAEMTNRFARFRQNQTEQAQRRLDFFEGLDTGRMSDGDRAHTENLKNLIVQREELASRMADPNLTGEERQQIGQQLGQMQGAIGQENAQVREILFKQIGEDLGYQGEEVGDFARYMGNIVEMTADTGRGPGGPGGFGGGRGGFGGGRGNNGGGRGGNGGGRGGRR